MRLTLVLIEWNIVNDFSVWMLRIELFVWEKIASSWTFTASKLNKHSSSEQKFFEQIAFHIRCIFFCCSKSIRKSNPETIGREWCPNKSYNDVGVDRIMRDENMQLNARWKGQQSFWLKENSQNRHYRGSNWLEALKCFCFKLQVHPKEIFYIKQDRVFNESSNNFATASFVKSSYFDELEV